MNRKRNESRAVQLTVICLAITCLPLRIGVVGQAQGPEKKAPNPQVVRVTGPDARSAVEVAVAIDPTNSDHIVGVSIQAGIRKKDPTSNYAYNSTDGGRTWKTVAQANPGKRTQGDDTIAFGSDGLAIRAYLAFDGFTEPRPKRALSGVWTSTSYDGLTWNNPVVVVDHINSPMPHEDKPWIRVDNSKDSPHKGNIYIAWTRFDKYGSKDPDHKSHIYFSRSTDAGKSFAVPHRISEVPGDCLDSSKTVMGAVPAVGPKGEVYVVWGGPLGLVMAKSTDGGLNFGKNQVLGETPGGWDFAVKGLGRCNGLPVVCTDVSEGKDRGSIYVTWIDLRNGDPDVFLIASRDGGETWSKPLRVNDDPKGNGKDQFFTWMAVDPVDGSVNIAFYDRRDTEGTKTGVTLARSIDGGRSFVNYKINQEPFACEPKTFFGDYLGIDAYGGRVVVLYHHFVESKRCAISSAVYDFAPGTQEARVEKKK
ncbi:MAG: exo-alpha-sialidase [Planctomycetes bacterium]|nr:exo-alpha-sialidase [Planctomycetota bacterium]